MTAVTEQRVFGLDLLRAVAISLVVFTHTSPILSQRLYKASVFTGFLGVELFFVLSGFLIGTILLKINARPGKFKFKEIRAFWVRRWFRTLPNYYLMFLVYALVFYTSHHADVFAHTRYLSYLAFLQNSFSYQPGEFFPVAWSLSIEEWFYLLFPLLLLLVSRLTHGTNAGSFVRTVLYIMVIELVLRLIISSCFNHYWDEGYRKLMPLRLDSIDIGVLAACVKFYRPDFWEKHANLMSICGLLILTGLSVYLYLNYINFSDPEYADHQIKTGQFLNTGFFTLAGVSIALMMPAVYSIKWKLGLVTRAATLMSKISYSMYLTHFLIVLVMLHVFKRYATTWYTNAVLFAAVWALTVAVSWVQYQYFELRMIRLRNKFNPAQAAIKVNEPVDVPVYKLDYMSETNFVNDAV